MSKNKTTTDCSVSRKAICFTSVFADALKAINPRMEGFRDDDKKVLTNN